MVKITNIAGALALGASTASAQTFKTYTDDNGIEFWQCESTKGYLQV